MSVPEEIDSSQITEFHAGIGGSGSFIPPQKSFVTKATILIAFLQVAMITAVPVIVSVAGLEEITDRQLALIYAGVTLIDVLFTIIISYHFACRKYKLDIATGFAIFPVRRLDVFKAIGIGVLLLIFGLLTSQMLIGEQQVEVWKLDPPFGAILFSFAALANALAIVLFYQGFMYSTLRWFGDSTAFLTTVTTYTLIAWSGRGPATAMVIHGLLACVLTAQRRKTGSIVPPLVTIYTQRVLLLILLFTCLALDIEL